MKILITTDLYTTISGVSVSVRNLSEELEKRGHDVRILTLSEDKNSYIKKSVYYIGSFSLEKIYPNIRGTMTFRHILIDELITWKPDVIHSQCEFFTFRFAKRIARKTGAPIVHTYHTLYEQYSRYVIKNQTLGRYLVRKFLRQRLKPVSAVVVPTYKVELVLNEYRIKKSIFVVPTGISLDQHRERISAEQRKQMREKYGISEDDFVLINIGRLGAEKSLDELILCLSWAVIKNENLKLLLVGDGPEKTNLQEWAEHLDVGDRVIFTGAVAPDEVQNYYQLGDVFVSASTSETQGLTYAEAAANGLPMLCANDLCFKGILENGKNGFAFVTLEEFEKYINRLQTDLAFYEKASEYSEELSENFDKAAFASSIERVYHIACLTNSKEGGKQCE